MRIGIDGGCLSNRRGFGRFARQTLQALAEVGDNAHEFVVLVDRPSLDQVEIPSAFETRPVEVREAPSRAASATGRRGVRDLLAMGRAAAKSRLDMMYFPASYSFFPVWNVGKVVVTMHDTLALAHPELVFTNWRGRLAWAVKEHAAVRWADRILTVSQAARNDLIAWFGLEPHEVGVVPEGPESVFRPVRDSEESRSILRKYRIDPSRRFLLYVGGLSPHKNLPRLLEAFATGASDDVDLILVGDTGDVFLTHVPALKAAVKRLGLQSRVNFTGFVPDAELAHLYSRAYALVQPSLMEGFGLPPVEAMACGTPILSSRAGSLPEVVGKAGIFFDPTDVGAMADAIRDFLGSAERRRDLAAKALDRSSLFTWSAAASALLECFDSLDAGRAPGRAA
ncbi:MAG: glycosyltransferase [Planctomycetota bacterium]|nr:glycosyltransferase [Planctomycetota bacterium]